MEQPEATAVALKNVIKDTLSFNILTWLHSELLLENSIEFSKQRPMQWIKYSDCFILLKHTLCAFVLFIMCVPHFEVLFIRCRCWINTSEHDCKYPRKLMFYKCHDV